MKIVTDPKVFVVVVIALVGETLNFQNKTAVQLQGIYFQRAWVFGNVLFSQAVRSKTQEIS